MPSASPKLKPNNTSLAAALLPSIIAVSHTILSAGGDTAQPKASLYGSKNQSVFLAERGSVIFNKLKPRASLFQI
jgi:hypothetical protein